MNCPKCGSLSVRYFPPERWNKIISPINPDKKGGYLCERCGLKFSFHEGIFQSKKIILQTELLAKREET